MLAGHMSVDVLSYTRTLKSEDKLLWNHAKPTTECLPWMPIKRGQPCLLAWSLYCPNKPEIAQKLWHVSSGVTRVQMKPGQLPKAKL